MKFAEEFSAGHNVMISAHLPDKAGAGVLEMQKIWVKLLIMEIRRPAMNEEKWHDDSGSHGVKEGDFLPEVEMKPST
jgi:hypothetical protein